MAESPPDTGDIVAAFAAREGLELSPDEHQRLCEYVLDSWEMASRLRDVETPGLEGRRFDLPMRAAYSNRPPTGDEAARAAPPRTTASKAEGQGSSSPEALGSTLTELAGALAEGELTPETLVRGALERIGHHDEVVRSYISVDREGAIGDALMLGAELRSSGPRSPLHGIPFGAKDNIPAVGLPCTYNSPFMRNWRPRRDAEAIRRLRAGGAVLVGKHNLNEFGWSIPSEDDLVPPPRNPWFPQEYSVGSSSGGGAAVAARLATFALGTDGGGSIRLPAAQHLLFGLKPGHGRAPSAGVTEGRVSEVSVLARHAEDVAAVLSVLDIDPDRDDWRPRLQSETRARIDEVLAQPSPLRIAIPAGYVEDVGMESDVSRCFDAVQGAIGDLGHELVELASPALEILHDAVRANFVVIAAEHYFDHEGPGKDRSRYGQSAGFYNLPGACLTAADYLHALRVGDIAREAVDEVLSEADMILTPTTPVIRTSTARNPKTHRRGGNAAYTSPFNITGHPAISMPAGVSAEGMPIGAQLVGALGSEYRLLQAGRVISESLELPSFPDLDKMRTVAGG